MFSQTCLSWSGHFLQRCLYSVMPLISPVDTGPIWIALGLSLLLVLMERCQPPYYRIRWFLRRGSEIVDLCSAPEVPEVLWICVLPVFSCFPPTLSCRVSARVLCAILTCISYLFWAGTINPFLYHWSHLSSVIPRGLDLTTANGHWDVDSHTKDFSLKAKGR